MVRFRGQVVVVPVPRRWLEPFIGELYTAFAESKVEDGLLFDEHGEPMGLALVEGRHATSGARYRLAEADGAAGWDIALARWGRSGESSIEIRNQSDQGTLLCHVRLDSVSFPRTVIVEGVYQGARRPRWLQRVAWTVRLDLEEWWDRSGHRMGGRKAAPLTAEINHSLARATLRAVPHSSNGDQWIVSLTVGLTGRSILRPPAAVVLLLCHRAIRRMLQGQLDEIAKEWNDDAPEAIETDPRDFIRQGLATSRSSDDDTL